MRRHVVESVCRVDAENKMDPGGQFITIHFRSDGGISNYISLPLPSVRDLVDFLKELFP